MTASLEKLLDKAKIAVFSDNNSAFLAVLLCSLEFSWNKDIETARTNGKILQINPDFFLGLPDKTRQFLIMHELWHVARAHPLRGGNIPNKAAWQYACDVVINNDLVASGYTYEGVSPLLNSKYPVGTSEEEIYDDVKDDIEDYSKGWEDLDEPSPAEKLEILENLVKAKELAKGKLAGTFGSQFESIITSLLPPKVEWKSLLHDFVSLSDTTEFSYRKRNRRFPTICLPGSTKADTLGEINYYLDVSGSVTDDDIARFNSELFYLMQMYELEHINVIQFDTQITKEEVVTALDIPRTFIGRGGTDLTCVKEHIEKTQPEFVIVFSDLECDPMEVLKTTPKMLWVIINNPNAIPPYGKYVHITT